MKDSREARRSKLETKAKELIDEMMAWSEQTERPSLSQMEEEILKLRKQMGEAMLRTLVEDQESQRPVPGPRCPKCGQEMRYKGDKSRQVTSRVGEVELERGYYRCAQCEESVFPPGCATGGDREASE
jgi:hypothetical protein